MKLVRRFLKIFPLVVIIAVIFLLLEWGSQQREGLLPEVGKYNMPEADLRIAGGYMVEMEGPRVVWQLESTTAQLFEKENCALLEDVKALYFHEDGRTINLTGKMGDLELATKNISLSGNVKVLSSDGGRLTAESLYWEDKQQKVTSDDWVTIEKDNIRVVGKGMEGSNLLSKVMLKNQVTTYINPN